jgi:hypothetical protein
VEYLTLVFLHVAFGIFWAGAAISLGLFVIPSVLEAGPAAGSVMAGVVKRKLPTVATVSATIVVLTGLRMYMIRFSTAWLGTPEGIVITVGALMALEAYVIGVFFQRPTSVKLAALGRALAQAGGPLSAAQAQELKDLQAKLRRYAAITAWNLVGASALMASHRLATIF